MKCTIHFPCLALSVSRRASKDMTSKVNLESWPSIRMGSGLPPCSRTYHRMRPSNCKEGGPLVSQRSAESRSQTNAQPRATAQRGCQTAQTNSTMPNTSIAFATVSIVRLYIAGNAELYIADLPNAQKLNTPAVCRKSTRAHPAARGTGPLL